jgi:hypothetical protein
MYRVGKCVWCRVGYPTLSAPTSISRAVAPLRRCRIVYQLPETLDAPYPMMFLSTRLVFRELGSAYCLVAKVPYNDNDLWYRRLQALPQNSNKPASGW